jgi:hypothetical protein
MLKKLFLGLIFFSFLIATSVAYAQYGSRPLGMSKKRFAQIKNSSKNKNREVAVVPSQFRERFWDRFRPSTKKIENVVNNNAINRKKNREMVRRKRREDENYSNYRDAMEYARSNGPDRSKFSVYDR